VSGGRRGGMGAGRRIGFMQGEAERGRGFLTLRGGHYNNIIINIFLLMDFLCFVYREPRNRILEHQPKDG